MPLTPLTRILSLSYCFPPAATAEAFVTAKLLANLPNATVDVVTATADSISAPVDHSMDDYVRRRMHQVVRVRGGSFLRRLGYHLPLRPDGWLLLNARMQRTANELGPDKYDCLVTRSQYHSVHLVGLRLKREYPNLPWIACLSDPWSQADYQRSVPVLSALSTRWERQVLASADALVFPTDALARMAAALSAQADGVPARSHVIPHAFDRQLYSKSGERPATNRFIIRLFGWFYGLRRVEPLLEAIRIIAEDADSRERLRLEFFGARPPTHLKVAEDPLLRELVKYQPRVDHIDALRLMSGADLLVVVDTSSHSFSPYLPSKLIDYLGAGSRVLAVCGQGETSRLVQKVGGLVASASDPSDIARAIRTAINEKTRWRPIKSAVSAFDATAIAARFQRIVDQLKKRC